ncbi:MAG: sensor histidine kinase [Amycolatopsis sp.]|nr:sensor histidine kinase [Amycolatopsis sp.]
MGTLAPRGADAGFRIPLVRRNREVTGAMPRRSRAAVVRTATLLLIVICVAYGVEPLFTADPSRGTGALWATIVGLAAFSATLAHVIWRGTRLVPDGKPWSLVLAGVLAVGIYLRFGPALVALPAIFCGAAAFTLTKVRAVALVVIVVGGAYLVLGRSALPAEQIVDLMGRGLVVMVVVYVVGTVILLSGEVERGRAELARVAVLEERLRFSRDVHDLLGHSLSVIALKGEVAARLVHQDPKRGAAEMDSVVDLARRSVDEVRSLVRGYRQQSLTAEIEGGVSVLIAAGVECTVDAAPAGLPERVESVFGWVVREAVTNVLRHSDATGCRIGFRVADDRATLKITNNGVRATPEDALGNGLIGLAERLRAVGGTLESGPLADGDFRLTASAPLEVA